MSLIQSFEGCRLTAYADATGVLTIGWGHTGEVNGAPITLGMTITQDTANDLLAADLESFETSVNNLVNRNLTPNQFAALVSFAYNEGVGALAGSTLLADVNAGNFAAAAGEFPKWVYADGTILEGLVARRAVEAKLFSTPDGAP